MGEIEQPNRPDAMQMRVSDAERHKVADLLRDAAAEGRLDMDELDERLETTYAAKTYADLVPITADLPALASHLPVVSRPSATPSRVPSGPSPSSSLALMSGVSRRGVWTLQDRHTAVAIMGGVELDLREARLPDGEATIVATAIMGGVDIVVNASTRVVVDGVGIMGAFEQERDRVAPDFDDDSPTVRVTGFALMGGVSVTRKAMPGERAPGRKELPPA